MAADLVIRAATPEDVPLVLGFIRAIAAYERLSAEVVTDEAMIRATLFDPGATVECLLAFDGTEPAGFAVYFHNYSTFTGRRGLWLEDLFVDPALRGRGIGQALLRRIAALAVERDCARMEWSVLDWNEPAIRFYESLGARAMSEWTTWRLTGDALRRVADPGAGAAPA
jgi:GNAT superfamily N-acetyltransferase